MPPLQCDVGNWQCIKQSSTEPVWSVPVLQNYLAVWCLPSPTGLIVTAVYSPKPLRHNNYRILHEGYAAQSAIDFAIRWMAKHQLEEEINLATLAA